MGRGVKLSSIGFYLVLALICVIAGFAVLVAFEAVYESVRLARAEGQILALVSAARDAARDRQFTLQPNEDLLAALWQRGDALAGQASPALVNDWGGRIAMTAAPPAAAWVETEVPVSACRQLALFFGHDAADIFLQKMQARPMQGEESWRGAYDAAAGAGPFDPAAAEAACGDQGRAALALLIKLR
ncbi:MAG TPA: hypothetical protein VMV79_01500 [Alphaproteobacteria bacterium]|nr:hypothetical protein [Alphaproteobacteria bacterium]